MPARIRLHDSLAALQDVDTLIVVGRHARLLGEDVRAHLPTELSPTAWEAMVRSAEPGDQGFSAETWIDARPRKVVAVVLPEECSRHNSPSRAWAIRAQLKSAARAGDVGILPVLSDESNLLATTLAIARAFPTFTATSRQRERRVEVAVLGPDGVLTDLDVAREGIEAVRFAAHLVDMPPNRLHTLVMVETARRLAARLEGVTVMVIQGDEVRAQGLGGLWGVGKASSHPPALVVLDYDPPGSTERTAWVGKGIVYDTGGLSIKSKAGMPGMKTDMAGAAAVLATFVAAVRLEVDRKLTAVLCVAENSVGPLATRPDDVLRMYSGRTVEVNNTDAEGRLVVADGLAWVLKNREVHELMDLATLTGAQATATGQLTGALYCSDEALERRMVKAGRLSGDLVHPLPYAPELFRRELSSSLADMLNSVKNRNNAQSSCAGQFLANHLGAWEGPWVHVDMAGPATHSGRGTGYGVGLLLASLGLA